jgi:hypothetical protein
VCRTKRFNFFGRTSIPGTLSEFPMKFVRFELCSCAASSDPMSADADDSAEAATPLDGELRAILDEGMRTWNVPSNDAREADRRTMDEITDDGRDELRAIAQDVFASLDDVSRVSNARAEELLENELQTTLDQFDERRNELIQSANAEREIIRMESERIKVLADSLQGNAANKTSTPAAFSKQNIRKKSFGSIPFFSSEYGASSNSGRHLPTNTLSFVLISFTSWFLFTAYNVLHIRQSLGWLAYLASHR